MLLSHFSRLCSGVVLLLVLTACTTSPRSPAPVENRSPVARATAPMAADEAPAASAVTKALPGSDNAGKPGFYTVQRGDTLTRIALDHGQSWRDLATWNQLSNVNLIEVGQVLRVVPPGASVDASGVVVQPIAPAAPHVSKPPVAAGSSPAVAPPASSPASGDQGLAFAWPASGPVIGTFDELRNKGLDIAGQAGDPVLAAADGQVVYAGSGLRGYGNLIILKHNNTFLTAYAHNQALLVKEDQQVRKGQRIAEMGKTDADRVKLHFEIRRQGKPVDPAKFLPAR